MPDARHKIPIEHPILPLEVFPTKKLYVYITSTTASA